jgi:hypothetical protein
VAANPEVYLEGSSVRTNGFNGTGTQLVHFALHDRAGVSTLTVHTLYADENHSVSTMDGTITIDPVTMTGTFTMPADDALGAAFVMESIVNIGLATEAHYQFGVFLLAPNGNRITCPNLTTQGDLANGWTPNLNVALRNALPGEGVAVPATPNTVVQRDGSGNGFFNDLTASELTSTGDLTLQAATGHTIDFLSGSSALGVLGLNGSSVQYNIDAARSGFGLAVGTANQFIQLNAITSGSAIYLDSAAVHFRDATQSAVVDWTLASGGATSMVVASTPTAFTISQADKTTNSGTAANLTIQAQNETGTGSTGGDLALKSGTGTSQDGFITLKQGSAVTAKFGVQNLVGQGNKTYLDFGASSGGMAASSQLISCSYGVGSAVYFFTNAGTCHFGQGGNLDVLTVDSGVGFNTSLVQFTSSTTAPFIKQADLATNGGTGAALTIQAQNETGTTSTGGALVLKGGTGTTTPGAVQIVCGSQIIGKYQSLGAGDARFTADASANFVLFAANGTGQQVIFQALGSSGQVTYETGLITYIDAALATAMTWTLNGTGATTMQLAAGVTSFKLSQNDKTTNSGTGAAFTIQAQNETGTGSTGGALNLTSGSGLTASGHVNISTGNGGSGITITDNTFLMSCVGGDTIFFCDASENITIGTGGTASVTLDAGGVTLELVGSELDLNVPAFKWISAVATPSISQADLTTNSGTGQAMTIHAQNETGTTSTGGSLTSKSGTGTSHDGDWQGFVGAGSNKGLVMHGNGNINLYANDGPIVLTTTVALFTIGGSAPLLWGTTTLSATTGTTTLSAAQQQTPMIVYSASLTGNVIVDFGNVVGNWEIDIAGVTLNAHTISVKSGTTTVALPTATTTKNLFNIRTTGSNGISIG